MMESFHFPELGMGIERTRDSWLFRGLITKIALAATGRTHLTASARFHGFSNSCHCTSL